MKKEKNLSKEVHPLSPIVQEDSEVLILGSFPSLISRRQLFYYANPYNRFWKMMYMIFKEDFKESKEEREGLLRRHRIALFDVLKSCSIEESKDSSIKSGVPNDIPSLIEGTSIKKIICNGRKAYSLLLSFFPELEEKTVFLPSTSPADASKSLDDLIKAYAKEILS